MILPSHVRYDGCAWHRWIVDVQRTMVSHVATGTLGARADWAETQNDETNFIYWSCLNADVLRNKGVYLIESTTAAAGIRVATGDSHVFTASERP